MAQAVEDVVETKVVGKRVKEGVFHLRNGAGFKIMDGGRRFKACHHEAWYMDPWSYRELAAELTAIADAMEFGGEKSAFAESAGTPDPVVFTVRAGDWPRLGLYNSGALAFFHGGDSRPATVIAPRGTHYEVGRKTLTPSYNPLPKDGVLIHQQDGDSFPKLGLSNSGELCLFEEDDGYGGGNGYVVAPEADEFVLGYKFKHLDYNPLPAGGVLLKPEV